MNWFFFFLASLVNLLPDYSWKKLLNGKIGLCGHFNKKASGYIGSLMSLEIFSCCPQTSPSGVKSLGEPFAPLVGRVSTQFLQIKCHYWSHGRGEDSLFLRHDLSYSVARCDRLWLHTLYPQSASFIPRPLHYWSRIISRQRRGINARWWYLSARRKHGSMESKLAILYFTFGRVAFGFFFSPPVPSRKRQYKWAKVFFVCVWTRGLIMKKCQLEKSLWAAGKGHFDKSHIFTQGATRSTQRGPRSQIIQRQGQSIIKLRLTVVWRRRRRQANQSG